MCLSYHLALSNKWNNAVQPSDLQITEIVTPGDFDKIAPNDVSEITRDDVNNITPDDVSKITSDVGKMNLFDTVNNINNEDNEIVHKAIRRKRSKASKNNQL